MPSLFLPTRITTKFSEADLQSKKEFTYDSFTYDVTTCNQSYLTCFMSGPITFQETSSRGNVKEIREFDWGIGAPGALLRRTKKEYLHEANSAYLPYNIVSKIITSTIYDSTANTCKGLSQPCAQAQYEYDQYVAGDNPLQGTSGAPQRASGFGASFTLRGNVTHVKRWLNTTGGLLTTTYSYDDLGNIRTIKDPLGHSTTYVYNDSFANSACPPPSGTNTQAWVSEVKNALNHRIQVTRFPCTGLVQARKDENDILAARAGTTFSYDLMNRLLQKILPDQGQEDFNYNLDPVPPVTTTTKKISTTPLLNLVSTANFDGLGRVMQTLLTDPDCGSGPVKVDSTYDVLGRKKKESNPYCGSIAGETETQYDALGRVKKVIPPDGTSSSNNVVTDYAGNTVTVTDQAGKQRRSYSDTLGRLVRVDEPGEGMTSGSPAAPATASVNIVGPLGVIQTQPAAQATGWVRINGSERSTQVTIETNCRMEWNPAGFEEWVCDYVTVTEWDFGIITLTVNGVSKSVNYGQSSTAANLASALAGQVNADGNYPVTAVVVSGNTINLTSRVSGASTNYALNITSQSQNTSYFSGTSFPVEKSGANLIGGADAVFTNDSGNVWVQIGSYTGNATYGSGSTPTSVANTLAAALTANSQANASVVTISSSQARIDLSAKQAGVAGNSMSWTGGATSNQPALFSPPSIRPGTASGNFSGGADAVLPQPNGIFSLDTPLITRYTYDALDNLTCVEQQGKVTGTGCSAPESSDASSPWRVRRFTYNSLGQLLSAKNPESGLITFAYDDDGNLKAKTSPDSNELAPSTATQTISYCYDLLHRMAKKFFIANPVCSNTAPVTYFYDQTSHNGLSTITNGIGRRTGMSDQSGATAWSYDPMGRPLTERRTIGTVTKETNYTYNFDGSLKSVSSPGVPAQVVNYSYNAAGRATGAVEGSISYVSAVKYTPAGAPCSLTNDASIVSTFTFNSRLQPLRMQATTSGAPPTPCGTISNTGTILDFEYNFNAGTANNGNVIGITNNRNTARSQSFTYDELNRLKTAQTTSNLWGNSYVYDAWANLLQKASITGKLESELLQVTVNGKNQMETSYCYDIAGNLVKQAVCPVNPLAIDYTYDEENQLETAGGVTYTYDGDGKRVKKSNGTLYWYGTGGQILKETDPAGNNPKDYIFFNGKRIARRDSATVIHYYFSDHLGSSNVVINKTGTTIEEESDFYPFGGERIVTNTLADQNYKFTGKERDSETNLDYFGARYYAYNYGRFTSPDLPLFDQFVIEPQSWNLYTYGRNNPLNGTDPTGRGWLSKAIKFVKSGGDVAATFAGVAEDAVVLTAPSSTTWQRVKAGGSILSEFLPVSARDTKAIGKAAGIVKDTTNQADNAKDVGKQVKEVSPTPTNTLGGGELGAPDGPKVGSSEGPSAGRKATPAERKQALSENDGQCRFCGAPAEHVDHAVPRSRGGNNTPENLQGACAACNLSKNNKTSEEFLRSRENK